jgi:hypothetical protein
MAAAQVALQTVPARTPKDKAVQSVSFGPVAQDNSHQHA